MQLVIRLPETKQDYYTILCRDSKYAQCIYAGAKFKTKKEAINHAKKMVFDWYTHYSETIYLRNDSYEAYDYENETHETALKLPRPRTKK